MNAKLLSVPLVLAVALAGCADQDVDDAPGTGTPSTTTPSGGTPATTTPATNGTGDEGTPPPLLDCPAPPTTNATGATKMGYPEVVFTVQEPQGDDGCFAFVGPATTPAGWTALTLRNDGMAPHIMPLMRLEAGKTLEDVEAAFEAGEDPSWAVAVGGVGFVTPFANATVLVDLQPGTYVVACFFDAHHLKGMYRALNVTAAPAGATPRSAPEADLTFRVFDFGYEVPENVTAGTKVVRFVNNGTQPHEAPLVALQGNATMEDFLAALEAPTGPPPGQGAGGVNVFSPGMTTYAIVDFRPGNYGFVCFVSDPGSGKPHVALGMVTQFAVAAG